MALVNCPKRDNDVGEKSTICSSCGGNIDDAAKIDTNERSIELDKKTKNKKNIKLIGIIISAIIIGIGVILSLNINNIPNSYEMCTKVRWDMTRADIVKKLDQNFESVRNENLRYITDEFIPAQGLETTVGFSFSEEDTLTEVFITISGDEERLKKTYLACFDLFSKSIGEPSIDLKIMVIWELEDRTVSLVFAKPQQEWLVTIMVQKK